MLLASNSASYIHCYWSILNSMKCFRSNSARSAVESLGVSGIAAPSLNPSSPLKFPFLYVFYVILCVRSFEGEVLLYTHCKNIWVTSTIFLLSHAQLHACCVCDTLQTSREATNLILNQSVVEKLLPLLN